MGSRTSLQKSLKNWGILAMSQAKKLKQPELCTEAKKKCRLTQAEIEKAQALGLNPKKLMANHTFCQQERWKAPVGEWIQEIYEKRFGSQKTQRKEPSDVEPLK
jgi:hypothetical protein